MSQRKHRLGRKARRVERSEAEKGFNEELGAVIRKRDETLFEANKMLKQDVDSAKDMHNKRKKDAWDAYHEARDKLVKKYAAQEVNERVTQ